MKQNKPSSQKRKLKPSPISNLDYLEAELHWVTHRCRRIGSERKQRDGADLKEQVEQLLQDEDRLRASIDAMRDRAKTSDKPFALDRLVASYQLSEFERLVVLLALAPAIDQSFERHYARLTRDGYSNGQCATVDTAFAFCVLDFGERVKHRAVFAANAPLSANGIVQVDLHDRYSNPEDLLTARLTLNAVTLGYLVGDDVAARQPLQAQHDSGSPAGGSRPALPLPTQGTPLRRHTLHPRGGPKRGTTPLASSDLR